MYRKLLLVTLFIFASVIQNADGTLSPWCPAMFGQSVFGVLCKLSDLTNGVVNASDICIKDCYCNHGNPRGGACEVNPNNTLQAYCRCEENASSPDLSVDCTTNPTEAALAVECGPGAAGLSLTLPPPLNLAREFTGEQVCALDCNCFHGKTSGKCTNVDVVTVDNEKRCKCT